MALDPQETCAGAAPSSAWFTPGRFALALAVMIAAAFPLVITGQQTFFHRDFAIFGYPLAQEHRACFWNGEWPLWNPFNNCGLPFLAQWNTLTLYPGSLIYLLLPLSWSLGLFCLCHLYGAGLGMYFLARSWTKNNLAAAVAGVAFAFGGLALSCVKWPNAIAALGWMPWVVWLAPQAWRARGGRAMAIAALAAAMQLLCGAPEIILFTWLFLAAFCLWDSCGSQADSSVIASETGRAGSPAMPYYQRLYRLGAITLLAVGLAAAQLGPFLDLLLNSQRQAAFAMNYWSMPAWGFANFIVPLFRCFPSHQGVFAQQDQYWISSYYTGIVILALGILALRRRGSGRAWFLVLVILTSLIAALGHATPLYELLRWSIPPLRVMRFPVKFVVLACFCLPLLAAEAVRILTAPPSNPAGLWRRLAIVLAGFTLAIVVIVGLAWRFPLPSESWPHLWRSGASRWLMLVLLCLLLVKGLDWTRPPWPRWAGSLCLVGLVWIDGLTHAPALNPTVERWVYAPGGQVADLLPFQPRPKLGESRALLTPDAEFRADHLVFTNAAQDVLASRLALFGNANLIDEIPKIDGFYSLYPRETDEWLAFALAPANVRRAAVDDFMSVSQISEPGKIFAWAARAHYLPLATGGQRPVFLAASNTLAALAHPGFDPRKTVCLPPEAAAGISAAPPATAPRIEPITLRRNRLEWRVEAAEPSVMVVAQSYYHPWRAMVDGTDTPIWRANHAFQAIAFPAGSHRIRLEYRDRVFQAGLGVSLASLVLCAWLWIAGGRQKANPAA